MYHNIGIIHAHACIIGIIAVVGIIGNSLTFVVFRKEVPLHRSSGRDTSSRWGLMNG